MVANLWEADDVLRVLIFLLCIVCLFFSGHVDFEVARRYINQRITAFYFAVSASELDITSLIAVKPSTPNAEDEQEEKELPAPRAIRLPVKRFPSSYNLFGDPSRRPSRRTRSSLSAANDAAAGLLQWLNPETEAATTSPENVDRHSQRTAAAAESDNAATPQEVETFAAAWANLFPLTCVCAFTCHT